jgi:hypothetical protein
MSEGGEESRKPQRIKQTQPKRPREPEAEEDEPAGGAGGVQEQGGAPGREWANGAPRKRVRTDRFVDSNNFNALYGDGVERESYNMPSKAGLKPGDAGFYKEHTLGGVLGWEVYKDKHTRTTKSPGFEGVPSEDDDGEYREGDKQASSESEEDDDTVSEGGTRTKKSGGPARKKPRDARSTKKRKNKAPQRRRVASGDASSIGTQSASSEHEEEEEGDEPAPLKAKRMLETAQARVLSILHDVAKGYGIFVFGNSKPGEKEGNMCRVSLKFKGNITPGETLKRDHVSWPRLIEALPMASSADASSIFEASAILSCSDQKTNEEIAGWAKGLRGKVVFPGQGRINPDFSREIFLTAMAYIANSGCEFPHTKELVLEALRVIGNQEEFSQLVRSIRPGKGGHRESIQESLTRFKTVTKLFDPKSPLVGELSDLYTKVIPTKHEPRMERTALERMLLAAGRITQAKLDQLKQKEVQQCMSQMAKDLFTDSELGISTQEWASVLKQEGKITAPLETELHSMVKAALAMLDALVKSKDKDDVERKFNKTFEYLYRFLPFLKKLVDAVVSSSNDIAGPAPALAAPVDTEESAEELETTERQSRWVTLTQKSQPWKVGKMLHPAANSFQTSMKGKDQKKENMLSDYKHGLVQAVMDGKSFKFPKGSDAATDFTPIIKLLEKEFHAHLHEYVLGKVKGLTPNEKQPSEVLETLILEAWEHACQSKDDEDTTKGKSIRNGGTFVLDLDQVNDPEGSSEHSQWLKNCIGYISENIMLRDDSLDLQFIPMKAYEEAAKSLMAVLGSASARAEVAPLDSGSVIATTLQFIAVTVGRGDLGVLIPAINHALGWKVPSYIMQQEVVVIDIDSDDDPPAAGASGSVHLVEGPLSSDQQKLRLRAVKAIEKEFVAQEITEMTMTLLEILDVDIQDHDALVKLLYATVKSDYSRLKIRLPQKEDLTPGKYENNWEWIVLTKFPAPCAAVYNAFIESAKSDDPKEQFKCYCLQIAFVAMANLKQGVSQFAYVKMVKQFFSEEGIISYHS